MFAIRSFIGEMHVLYAIGPRPCDQAFEPETRRVDLLEVLTRQARHTRATPRIGLEQPSLITDNESNEPAHE